MGNRKIWANAVLKDGKLMFWRTGNEKHEVWDFIKDFLYSGMDMRREIASGKYELKKIIISSFDDTSFYEQFELHENFKGNKPY